MKTNRILYSLLIFTIALFFWGMFTVEDADAATHEYNISNGKVTIKNNDTYKIFGNTNKNYIIVKDDSKPTIIIENLNIDLCDEDDDDDSVEAAPICIEEGSSATIIVKGTNNLYGGNHTGIGDNWGYAGINIEKGASLRIEGEEGAKLYVHGGGDYSGAQEGGAGIGSDANNDMGSLVIDGDMIIEATGAIRAAGIGSGNDTVAGNITINNGNITARGGKYAAGIGCGNAVGAGDGGDGKNITITGGTVKAYGGTQAAGIGGSDEGDVNGTIKISGGDITAEGGEKGAGIGGGEEGYTNAIEITGGNIEATGGKWAAGIGGGNAVAEGDGGDIGSILITGGNIEAAAGGGGNSAEGGAGIGGSDGGEVGSLKIEEKDAGSLSINAVGGNWGAGIGSAAEGVTSHNIESIYIKLNGGQITAKGGYQGAGIGGGNTSADKIEIYGEGNITATGLDQSCAIGAGECEDGGDIIIKGTEGKRVLIIDATTAGLDGAAAIGAADAKGGDISISNAEIKIHDNNRNSMSAGIGNAVNHQMAGHSLGDIIIDNCKITDEYGTGRRGASIGAGWDSDVGNITIKNSDFTGGNIGSSYNGNDVFRETMVDSITIENSNIDASNGSDVKKAAIGSGTYCAIYEITIKDSVVKATTNAGAGIGSGGYKSDNEGDPFKWTGCECGDITITGSEVIATGADGGAGIGGGWGTSAGDITIKDSEITASSIDERDDDQGGAGIGGGYAESVGAIIISNSTVEATGGANSAAIGSSGYYTAATTVWNTTCHSIEMKGSVITAKGGARAAAIGTGCGAQFSWDAYISIDNCTVNADGGGYGAGIGAGSYGWADAGAEADIDISITGTSKVRASGGFRAAGIGGGCDGGLYNVYIDLEETSYDTDSAEDIKWKYYVIATGGDGAAGIGAGHVRQPDTGITAAGHSVEKVEIVKGYVYAQGGKDVGLGSGAGIGGGAHGGELNNFIVTGGFVEAHAGEATRSDYTANDIGAGGNDVSSKQDGTATISGGTVLGGISEEFDIYIDGGSVRYNTNAATRTDKTKVYRTLMQTGENYFRLDGLKTSVSGYGTTDIYSDEAGKVYLYLPTAGENKSTADYNHYGDSRHYYGTVSTGGNGWLKMGTTVSFEPPEDEPIVGQAFELKLQDGNLPDGTEVKFSVSGDDIEIVDDGTVTIVPGAKVQLKASDFTDYTVRAEIEENFNSEMYWGTTAEYKGSVTVKTGSIEITEDSSKVYDGEAVEDPAVRYESDALSEKIQYKYYAYDSASGQKDSYLGDGVKPKDAGTYAVEAILPGTDKYTEAVSDIAIFTIEKKPVTMEIVASENGTDATVTAKLSGYISADDELGKVEFTIGNTMKEAAVSAGDDVYTASISFEDTSAGVYTVKVELTDADNYAGIPEERTFNKSLVERTINIQDTFMKTYGNDTFKLEPECDLINGDTYSYEVVDSGVQAEGIEAAVIVEDGTVIIRNAGVSVIKISLPQTATHSEAVAYTKVIVKRAELDVTPYAYILDDNGGEERVQEITYGTLDQLKYGIDYSGLIGEDTPYDFTKGRGILKTAPLNEAVGAGEYALTVEKVPTEGEIYFISRNYRLNVETATLKVTPATLYIAADDKTGVYGTEPEYTYHFGDENGNFDLMPWDKAEDIVSSIGLEDEKAYDEYKPGLYSDEIVVTLKSSEESVTAANYAFTNNGSSTVSSGDLTIQKADLVIETDIPSKIYDGKTVEPQIKVTPILSGDISADQLASIPDTNITYFEVTDNGREQLDNAPIDAGKYEADIATVESDYYNSAECTVSFTIKKARIDIYTPEVPDMEMKDGLKLSEQSLPEGWAWINPDRELNVGYINAYAVYTPEDQRNYYKEIRTIGFTVYEKEVIPGSIEITEDLSKVYDGEPVTDPNVTYNSDVSEDKIEYRYYKFDKVNNTISEFLGAGIRPNYAGDYAVVASMPATDNYSSASSGLSIFTIDKKPVMMDITATETVTNAEITAVLAGYVGTEEELAGTGLGKVKFTIADNETEQSILTDGSGKYYATVVFTDVAAAEYTVKAELTDSENYIGIPVEKTFKKGLAQRSIEIDTSVFTKTYGDEAFDLAEHIKVIDGEKADEEDYVFDIVYNAGQAGDISNTVSVDEKGKVTIDNAGLAVIKISLPGSDMYSEAVVYTTVIVKRAELIATPYAYNKDDENKTAVTKAIYGTIDSLAYDISYNNFVNGDDTADFTNGHGTLEVTPLDGTAGVGVYTLCITKMPGENEESFVSRNYDLVIREASFEVTPAILYISADDKASIYGDEPEYTYSFGNEKGDYGLMPWDEPREIIASVGLKNRELYADYKPGIYEDVITVTIRDVKDSSTVGNYIFINNRNSTINDGDLTIEKADILLEASIASKIYDGKSVEPQITVEPELSGNVPKEELEPCPDAAVTYFEVFDDGIKGQLQTAPRDAGRYEAKFFVAESNCYNSAEAVVSFTIEKAHRDVDTPEVPDIEMRDGLTLSEQELPEGWAWDDPDRELAVGHVSACAIYTPEDERNYFKETRTVEFMVYEKEVPIEPDEPTEPEQPTEPNEPTEPDQPTEPDEPTEPDTTADNSSQTGDDSSMTIAMMVMLGALIAMISVVCIRRKKIS